MASRKADLIRIEFSEIKALIEERENQTLKVITDEEKRVSNKFDYIYGVLTSKKNEIQSLRDQIEMALTEGDDILFLKVIYALDAAVLPWVVSDCSLCPFEVEMNAQTPPHLKKPGCIFCPLHKAVCMRAPISHFREQRHCNEHQQKMLMFLQLKWTKA